MSLHDPGPQPKLCFVYCGDDLCNCYSAPRYRNYKMPSTSGGLFQDPSIQNTFQETKTVTEVDTSDDFGFSTVEHATDSSEPSYEELCARIAKYADKVERFLGKLAQNPEKDIHWPNRDVKIAEFKKQLDDIMDGK